MCTAVCWDMNEGTSMTKALNLTATGTLNESKVRQNAEILTCQRHHYPKIVYIDWCVTAHTTVYKLMDFTTLQRVQEL